MNRPSGARVIVRGLFRRCPRCGERPIFDSFFNLKPACPRCSFDFDREPGWWIGGMVINISGAILLFALILGVGLFAFWPDVPWVWLTVLSVGAMGVFPVIFYPISKTVWLGVDLLMTKMDAQARE